MKVTIEYEDYVLILDALRYGVDFVTYLQTGTPELAIERPTFDAEVRLMREGLAAAEAVRTLIEGMGQPPDR